LRLPQSARRCRVKTAVREPRGLSNHSPGFSIGKAKSSATGFSRSSPRNGRPGNQAPKTPSGDLTGRWDVSIEFAAGISDHTLHVRQQGNQLMGTHQGDFVARDFSGTISAYDVRISSSVGEVRGAALSYRFTGKLDGDKMSGALDMGEYMRAKWTATRRY